MNIVLDKILSHDKPVCNLSKKVSLLQILIGDKGNSGLTYTVRKDLTHIYVVVQFYPLLV